MNRLNKWFKDSLVNTATYCHLLPRLCILQKMPQKIPPLMHWLTVCLTREYFFICQCEMWSYRRMSEGLWQEWVLWLTGLGAGSSQTSFRIPFAVDQCLFLFPSSFLTVFLEHLQKNLRIPLLTALSALPSDMAAFHQQSRGEELKGVSLSENTDVITDHDHCSQAQPEVDNQHPDSRTPAISDHLATLSVSFWALLRD